MWSDESNLSPCSWEKWFWVSVPKTNGTIQTFIRNKQKHTSVIVWGPSVQTAWVTGIYVRRYHWHGGIYWDYSDILPLTKLLSWEVIVIRSRQCQLSFCTCYNCMAWKDTCGCDWLASRSVYKYKCMVNPISWQFVLIFGFCLAFCLLLR